MIRYKKEKKGKRIVNKITIKKKFYDKNMYQEIGIIHKLILIHFHSWYTHIYTNIHINIYQNIHKEIMTKYSGLTKVRYLLLSCTLNPRIKETAAA